MGKPGCLLRTSFDEIHVGLRGIGLVFAQINALKNGLVDFGGVKVAATRRQVRFFERDYEPACERSVVEGLLGQIKCDVCEERLAKVVFGEILVLTAFGAGLGPLVVSVGYAESEAVLGLPVGEWVDAFVHLGGVGGVAFGRIEDFVEVLHGEEQVAHEESTCDVSEIEPAHFLQAKQNAVD